MSSSKCSFTCICGIFFPLNPSTTTVYAWSAFYPSLRFTLSLQSAFYTQSAFYPWSAVCSPQSAVCVLHWPKRDICFCNILKVLVSSTKNRKSTKHRHLHSCAFWRAFFLFFGYSLLVLKKPVVMCSFYLNRLLETTCFQWWPLALHLHLYFYSARWSVKSSSETASHGVRALGGLCVYDRRGGLGARFGPGSFFQT